MSHVNPRGRALREWSKPFAGRYGLGPLAAAIEHDKVERVYDELLRLPDDALVALRPLTRGAGELGDVVRSELERRRL